MTNNNLYIFPLIKKSSEEISQEIDNVSEEDIDAISKHYMGQIANHLGHHGIKINKIFLRDFDVAYEFFRSSIMRSVGIHHPFQDYVDDIDEIVFGQIDIDTEEEKEEE